MDHDSGSKMIHYAGTRDKTRTQKFSSMQPKTGVGCPEFKFKAEGVGEASYPQWACTRESVPLLSMLFELALKERVISWSCCICVQTFNLDSMSKSLGVIMGRVNSGWLKRNS